MRTAHAVITATAFRPDVAIVDLTPADLTGFRIAGQLQALPDAPVILLTSSATDTASGLMLTVTSPRQGRPVRPDHHSARRPART
jgi:DNA-binding response OmpR family regulator